MNKRIFALAFLGAFLLLTFTSLSSAYYYYFNSYAPSNDYYDSYSSHTSHTSGYGPFISTKTTNYDKVKENYWNGHDWVERTTYVKETRETPNYFTGYGNYGGYGNYYSFGYTNMPRYGNYGNYGGYPYSAGGYENYYNNYYPSYRTNW